MKILITGGTTFVGKFTAEYQDYHYRFMEWQGEV